MTSRCCDLWKDHNSLSQPGCTTLTFGRSRGTSSSPRPERPGRRRPSSAARRNSRGPHPPRARRGDEQADDGSRSVGDGHESGGTPSHESRRHTADRRAAAYSLKRTVRRSIEALRVVARSLAAAARPRHLERPGLHVQASPCSGRRLQAPTQTTAVEQIHPAARAARTIFSESPPDTTNRSACLGRAAYTSVDCVRSVVEPSAGTRNRRPLPHHGPKSVRGRPRQAVEGRSCARPRLPGAG